MVANLASHKVMMFRMIEELVNDMTLDESRMSRGMTNQRTLFPEPASKMYQNEWNSGPSERTLSVDPQQAPRRLPFLEDSLSKEPLCRTFMLRRTRNILIFGWVGGG